MIATMSDLYETTLNMIRDSGIPITRLASEAKVGQRWLADLVNGRFSDPGVKKIQRLHDYLKQQQKAA
jgi:predicted transcriptional regulator